MRSPGTTLGCGRGALEKHHCGYEWNAFHIHGDTQVIIRIFKATLGSRTLILYIGLGSKTEPCESQLFMQGHKRLLDLYVV